MIKSFRLPALALLTFTTRLAFDAAAPGLPTETFESGLVAPGSVITCAGPVSSTAASACFPAGGLLPSVSYNSEQAVLALLGANFDGVGNTSKVLGPNFFADTFNLTFTSANAAGFDVFAGPAAGNVAISVFSPANAPLSEHRSVTRPGRANRALPSWSSYRPAAADLVFERRREEQS